MTYKLLTTLSVKKAACRAIITMAILACAPVAMAQEEGTSKGVLVPNLTVNIKLNSALGEKETEFYSKIAQDLISKLPRQLNVDKQASALKDLDEAYKHLNVVTYLPPTDDVKTDKLIKHFKVNFVFDDENGAKSADEVEDIILPKELQGESVVGLDEPDTTEETARPSMIDQMVQNQNQEPVAIKPEPKVQPIPVITPTPEPKPTPVAALTPKPTPKSQAASAPRSKVNRLRLAFDTDETVLSVEQRVETMKFIQKLRSLNTKQPDGFVFVVRSYEGPIGVEDNLGEARLRSVTALLRQQDINVSRSRVTEIFVRTNEQQFVEVEPVY